MQRYVIGVSGATGTILAIRLMQELRRDAAVELHLIATPPALRTLRLELPELPVGCLQELAHVVHDHRDIAAAPSSGTFRHQGMVVIPCSISTASEIALGLGKNLLVRAADVTLKEGRRLVVVPREAPLHAGHLRNLTRLAEIGACVLPPMLAFYHRPRTMEDLIDHVVGRVLDQLGREHALFRPWSGPQGVADE